GHAASGARQAKRDHQTPQSGLGYRVPRGDSPEFPRKLDALALDFSATARWPNVTPLAVAKALTKCRHGANGLPEPRMVLPSMATCFSGSPWQASAIQRPKQSSNPSGARRANTRP